MRTHSRIHPRARTLCPSATPLYTTAPRSLSLSLSLSYASFCAPRRPFSVLVLVVLLCSAPHPTATLSFFTRSQALERSLSLSSPRFPLLLVAHFRLPWPFALSCGPALLLPSSPSLPPLPPSSLHCTQSLVVLFPLLPSIAFILSSLSHTRKQITLPSHAYRPPRILRHLSYRKRNTSTIRLASKFNFKSPLSQPRKGPSI